MPVSPLPDSTRPPKKNSISWSVFTLLALAVIVRTAWIFSNPSSFQEDPDAYRALAVAWHQSGTFGLLSPSDSVLPTAYRPPAYPWLLSWFVVQETLPFPAIATLHSLLFALTLAPLYPLAKHLLNSQTWACLACCLATIDPILLQQSRLIMTESLATTLAVWSLFGMLLWDRTFVPSSATSMLTPPIPTRLGRSRWIAIGLLLSLNGLCRPTGFLWVLLWILFSGIMLLRAPQTQSRRPAWTSLLAILALVLATQSTWAYRNAAMLGKPILFTSHGGYTLYLANNPWIYEHYRLHGPSRHWDATPFHADWQKRLDALPNPHDEFAIDDMANQLARKTITQQPLTFATSTLIRTIWLWAWWPNHAQPPSPSNHTNPHSNSIPLTSWLIGAWYGLWHSLAILGLWRLFQLRHSLSPTTLAWKGTLTLALSLTLVHAVYWSNMRMRAPIMPSLYILALWSILPHSSNTPSQASSNP